MKNSAINSRILSTLLNKSLILLNSLAFLLAIFLCFTLFLFFFTPLQHAIAQNTLKQTGFSKFDISTSKADDLRNQIVSFYITGEKLNNSLFSEIEIKHYEDVKNTLFYAIIFFLITSAYSIWYGIIKIHNHEYSQIINATITAQIILIVVSLFVVVFFDFFWISIFHELLFTGGYMILEPEFISYNLFSHQFFMISTIFIVTMTLLSLELLKRYCKYLITSKNSA